MEPTTLEQLLRSALAPLVPSRLNGTNGPWALATGPALGGTPGITVDGQWVGLHRVVPDAEGPPALDALAAQADWPGGAKQVGWQPAMLRADIPLLVDTAAGRDWVLRQLRAAGAGVLGMLGLPGAEAGKLPSDGHERQAPALDPELIAQACLAAGWSAAARPDGSVHLDLQLRAAHRVIVLCTRGSDLRVSVTLASDGVNGAPPACRAAAADFLLRCAAALRWARPFVGLDVGLEAGQAASVGFECLVAAPCEDRALLLAVDTLVAACQHYGRELELLLERPDIAALYGRCQHGAGPQAESATATAAQAHPLAARLFHPAQAALA